MSQSELQKLLYGALASGSGDAAPESAAAALAAQYQVDAVTAYASTPAEIIAHYDFRVKVSRDNE
jgi:hypothetical protein